MQPPAPLIDPTERIIADASTVISITASEYAVRILSAIPDRFVVPDVVVSELEAGIPKGRTNAEQLRDLINDQAAEVVTMSDEAAAVFEHLVIGSARNTLDDGEAATIACAVAHGGIPLIDERKARRVCDQQYPNLAYGCSVDLFAHPNVHAALGEARLADALYNALKKARMRVLQHHLDWVANLIGPERVIDCESLPPAVRAQASERLRGAAPGH